MSDIRLPQLKNGKATELQGDAFDLEKPLQNLREANLNPSKFGRKEGFKCADH